jgi:exopolyphosphatase/guanosine-5'-triphosphate,3'-diphosphate pyrophosphatase
MRITAIDIGTNTVLLLVADIDDAGSIATLAYEQRIPRLGKDVDAQKVIGRAAFERVADVLQEYKIICTQHKPERIVAVGTSAVREARNREEFIAYIRTQTGIEIEVLTGEEEAKLAYYGAISGLRVRGQKSEVRSQIAVIDIGGGSTEITVGTQREILHNVSVDVGSVRLTEKFLKHNPPLASELQAAKESVVQSLTSHIPYFTSSFDFAQALTVGVAGTATTLALLDQGLKEFDLEKISSYKLTKSSVGNLLNKLQKMKYAEILNLSSATAGRADILTAGTLILHTYMEQTGVQAMTVSERGVRYGIALREWKR